MKNSAIPVINQSNIARSTSVGWLRIASAVTVLLSLPLLIHAEEESVAIATTVEWYQLGDLPIDSRGVGQQDRSVFGPFVGVHNNALIVAGGASVPVPPIQQSTVDQPIKAYSNTIRVAVRNAGSDRNGDGEIAPDERPLTWYDAQPTLPGNRAFGASASHELGLIAIGGTDGEAGYSDAMLIRWNAETEVTSLLMLPMMPGILVDGRAVTIGDTVFVLTRTNGAGSAGEIYALDLSRILTDDAGAPVADGDIIGIAVEQDERGIPVSPWQQLPSLPLSDSENQTCASTLLAAQNDGRGDRLYVFGHCGMVWAYNPHAENSATSWARKAVISIDGQPVGLGAAASAALGQSHILLLEGPDDNNQRDALSYNAVTDAWTSYSQVSPTLQQVGTTESEAATVAIVSNAVRWGDDTVLIRSDLRPGYDSPIIWAVRVRGPESRFGWQNMTVLVIYLLSMVMVGVYFVYKNDDTDDYFRGGQNIPWWAAACSIYATMMSSLTFIALPALVYLTDWLVYLGVLGLLVVVPISVYVALPFFRQIDATSAYEYLSKRFNMPVRLFASGLFTLFQIGRMGIVLALTALALAAVTPLDAWQSVLIMGVLSLIYSTLGGIEAVIWTDTIQTIVLLIGAFVCFGFIVAGIEGGFSGFIDSGMAGNKFRMVDWDFGPGSIVSLSIWVVVLGGIGQNLSSYTADQAVVQRYMTTKDTRAAAKSIWTNAVITIPGTLLFFFIGTGLYSFYQAQPGKLDPTIQIDQIFPAFIGTELPVGIAGLIVAGIFAAAQSTVSTSMNSMATTLVTDFMRPFNACHSEDGYLTAARLLTVLTGILGTATGLLFISPEIRSLMEEYFKVIGMFMGALGGVFVLGVTTRRANSLGALLGIVVSVGVMVTLWRMQSVNGYLFSAIGILSCVFFGYMASLLLPSDEHDIDGLTIYTMRRDLSD